MTSRDRVLKAINHQEPDRVPIDLGSTIVSGISPAKYGELREHLGLGSHPIRVYDVYLMLAEVELEVLDWLNCDTVMLPWLMRRDRWGIRLDAWRPWRLSGGTPVEVPANFRPERDGQGSLLLVKDGRPWAKMPREGFYFDLIEERRIGQELPDTETARYAPLTDEELEFIQAYAERLYRETDKALIGDGGGMDLDIVGSFEEWLMLLAAQKGYMDEFYTNRVDSVIANLKLYRQAVGDRIAVIFFGQDFGMQDRELLSPRMFQDLIAGHYRRIFAWIHQHTDWKVMFHSDGSIFNLLPMMADMGVDILNPVQCTAANMEPKRLKRMFGDRLVFWGGGVDSTTVLLSGTDQEVRKQVRERIRTFAPGGGYVFSPVHNIQPDVPVENVVAAYEAAAEYGQYPV
jgi:uroporphyrinogen decarboxylase